MQDEKKSRSDAEVIQDVVVTIIGLGIMITVSVTGTYYWFILILLAGLCLYVFSYVTVWLIAGLGKIWRGEE